MQRTEEDFNQLTYPKSLFWETGNTEIEKNIRNLTRLVGNNDGEINQIMTF